MAKNKFLLVSLKEDESKQLAQVMANDSARKILDKLAEKEHTESDLAKDLGVPLSTVHYNLQALLKAKLVEAEEFHYSEKGKEVLHYKLANQYIIIAPKSTFGIRERLKSILPVVGLAAVGTWVIQFLTKTNVQSAATELAPQLAAKSAPVLADSAGNTMMRFAAETAPVATQVVETGFSMSPALWFLAGCILTACLILLGEYIQYRRKN